MMTVKILLPVLYKFANKQPFMIQEDVLLAYGATFRKYNKNQCVFFEGNDAVFFYQVSEGSVRMANVFEDGKEFIQGIFKQGESFGEPVLLTNNPYPATAIANEDTIVLKMVKQSFMYMLHNNEDVLFELTTRFAKRLYMKATIAKEISWGKPHQRIATLLQMLKTQSGCLHTNAFKIQLSRQRIADMLGLRVETVIRAMKKLEEDGLLVIKNGKAYL